MLVAETIARQGVVNAYRMEAPGAWNILTQGHEDQKKNEILGLLRAGEAPLQLSSPREGSP